MARFFVRRVISGIGVLWGIVTLVFVIGFALPINPALASSLDGTHRPR